MGLTGEFLCGHIFLQISYIASLADWTIVPLSVFVITISHIHRAAWVRAIIVIRQMVSLLSWPKWRNCPACSDRAWDSRVKYRINLGRWLSSRENDDNAPAVWCSGGFCEQRMVMAFSSQENVSLRSHAQCCSDENSPVLTIAPKLD